MTIRRLNGATCKRSDLFPFLFSPGLGRRAGYGQMWSGDKGSVKCDRRKERSKVQFFRALVQKNAGNVVKRRKTFCFRDKIEKRAGSPGKPKRGFGKSRANFPREKNGISGRRKRGIPRKGQGERFRKGTKGKAKSSRKKVSDNFPKRLHGAPFSDILNTGKSAKFSAGKT